MAYLRIANLKKSYFVTREETQEVLKGVNVEFRRGELVAILGESGSGKSTLLNIIGGLDFNYTGSIVADGNFIRDYTEAELDDYRKKWVGFVFQNINLIKHLTVLENVTVAMAMSDVKQNEREARAKELLESVGLTEYYHKLPNQLSGGQKQRVAIARALANDPNIILADEPTGSLDAESADEIFAILKKISESGKLVLIVTHSQKIAGNCTRIVKLENGVIIQDQRLAEINTNTPKPKDIKPKQIGFSDIFKLSLRNVFQNLKRNILVTIAMSIGVAAVVLMLSLGNGIRSYVNNEIATTVNRLQIDVVKDANAVGKFTPTDVKRISILDGVDEIIESSSVELEARYRYTGTSDDTYATLLSLMATFKGFTPQLRYGELPKDGEILISSSMASKVSTTTDGNARVKLSDEDICKDKKINLELNGVVKTYAISGIINDASAFDTAYISENDLNSYYGEDGAPVNRLYVMATDTSYIAALVDDIEFLGFIGVRQDSTVEDLISYVDMGQVVLTLVAAVSLVVSAIMIFVVIYISFIERTKEIGILRAIGSKRADIGKMFFTESALLGIAAGIVGSLIALITGLIVNASMKAAFVSLNPLFYLGAVVGSALITVFSGLSPATLAANADPVECLRFE